MINIYRILMNKQSSNKDIKKYEQYDESYIINEFVNKDDIDILCDEVYEMEKGKRERQYCRSLTEKLSGVHGNRKVSQGCFLLYITAIFPGHIKCRVKSIEILGIQLVLD